MFRADAGRQLVVVSPGGGFIGRVTGGPVGAHPDPGRGGQMVTHCYYSVTDAKSIQIEPSPSLANQRFYLSGRPADVMIAHITMITSCIILSSALTWKIEKIPTNLHFLQLANL